MCCDAARGVAYQEGHNLQVHSVDTRTKTDMSLDMMLVPILREICEPCCLHWFAMPEVAICTENLVIPALGAEILFRGERLEYPPEYLIQHLPVCLPLLIQWLLGNIAFLDRNWQESDRYKDVR
jgi:hypothetical protein